MTDPIRDRPVRPLPGSASADAAVRPRTWYEAIAGWPDGLPFDRRLRDRARYELSRSSIKQDFASRSRGRYASTATIAVSMASGWFVYMGVHLIARELRGDTALAMVIPFAFAIPTIFYFSLRIQRRIKAPRLRAGLRREGIDCCIDCGHLIGRGNPADTCPECQREHADFPLGWGPGIAGTPGTRGDDPE